MPETAADPAAVVTTVAHPAPPAPGSRRRRSRRGPSLADVAAAAGVSPITASRVANGHANVEIETRTRVLDAMRELQYRPNVAARALATGRFRSIGVVTFALAPFGNAATIEAVTTAAADHGSSVTLMRARRIRTADVQQAVDALAHQNVDGVVVLAEQRFANDQKLVLPPDVPHVFIDDGAGPEAHVVDSDQGEGARLATQHLLDLGHTRIHHLRGPRRSAAAGTRADVFARTMREAGLTPPALLQGDWTSEAGMAAADAVADLARGRAGLTAVFSANDQMALGLLHGLHGRGIAVPGEVSVVGYDDVPDSAAYRPSLTTVRQRFDEVGRIAVEQLLRRVEHPDSPIARTLVPVELVVRDSACPPRTLLP